jgi:DNA-binding MurR/RpiR family transcriptional regulator
MSSVKSVPSTVDLFRKRMEAHMDSLTPAGARVVEFIDQNRGATLASTAVELAAHTQTSDATVVRVVQTLGFAGLPELKLHLAISVDARLTPADKMRHTLKEFGGDAGLAIDTALRTHQQGLEALQQLDARHQMLSAVTALQAGDRIVTFGIGPTAPIAKYASILLARSGYRASTMDAAGAALADQLLDLHTGDALLILAYAPAYPEVLAVFAEAKRLRLSTVLVTDRNPSKLSQLADLVVPVQRGMRNRVALHATTVACLEAIVLGVSAVNHAKATGALDRLNNLRDLVKLKAGSTS